MSAIYACAVSLVVSSNEAIHQCWLQIAMTIPLWKLPLWGIYSPKFCKVHSLLWWPHVSGHSCNEMTNSGVSPRNTKDQTFQNTSTILYHIAALRLTINSERSSPHQSRHTRHATPYARESKYHTIVTNIGNSLRFASIGGIPETGHQPATGPQTREWNLLVSVKDIWPSNGPGLSCWFSYIAMFWSAKTMLTVRYMSATSATLFILHRISSCVPNHNWHYAQQFI